MTASEDSRMARTAIVIGAGHNGLVTANYLAEGGFEVTVLERRDIVGGACVTEELIPGFLCSSCAFVAGPGLEPRIWRDFDLSRYGLELYQADPLAVSIDRSGRSFLIHRELDRTLAQIQMRFGRREAAKFVRFGARLERVARLARPALLADPPTFEELRDEFRRRGDGDPLGRADLETVSSPDQPHAVRCVGQRRRRSLDGEHLYGSVPRDDP